MKEGAGLLGFRLRRFNAMVVKESLQVTRDPSAILIAFVLPPVLLFLFAFAMSLDIRNVPVAVVLESDSAGAAGLAAAYGGSRYFEVTPVRHRDEAQGGLVSGRFKAVVVIPADFDRRLMTADGAAAIQVITDGSQPNTASFAAAYSQATFANWLASRPSGAVERQGPVLVPRVWFNPELESRRVLLPGAMAIVMTLIGTLLTALVIAREWERGTMESVMSTPATMLEIVFSKLLPYFVLGSLANIFCALQAVLVYGLPLRGSPAALLLVGSVFLVPALGQGLLISSLNKNQFNASQIAVMTGFLPALLLSGFLFEISSMPTPIQWITWAVPARHYVASLQTIFLAGDVWPQLLRDMAALLTLGGAFFAITLGRSRKRLD